jgi:hypothetical protein
MRELLKLLWTFFLQRTEREERIEGRTVAICEKDREKRREL